MALESDMPPQQEDEQTEDMNSEVRDPASGNTGENSADASDSGLQAPESDASDSVGCHRSVQTRPLVVGSN